MSLSNVDFSQLPVPEDKGVGDLLLGKDIGAQMMASTDGPVTICLPKETTLLFIFPMIGHPNVPLPKQWDATPGARGCTPQACAYRDLNAELLQLGINRIFGISGQSITDLRERQDRLHIPFPLISDRGFAIGGQLGIPTFDLEGQRYYTRATLIISNGRVVYARHPVFPPDGDAATTIKWLEQYQRASKTRE